MSERKVLIKTAKVVYPQLYSYVLPTISQNEGSQKIGYTERHDVDQRIREQTQTAAMRLDYRKLWSAPAFFKESNNDFTDKDFHAFLKKQDVPSRPDLGTEWFYFNGTPEKSKQLFDVFREKGFAALQSGDHKMPYVLRTEQQAAVDQAVAYFASHAKGEFLWNAKPRFGKTLASYDLAKRLDAHKVLIVTNRPAIANSWFDDFDTFIEGYKFISETSSIADRPTLTRDQFIESGNDLPQITFLSLQDLKGSKYFGGPHDKLRWVADLEWDLLIIDEAHEGVDTGRTDAAFNNIRRKYTLHLSGTPFKALANNKFPDDAIFNWTYLDEQKIKQAEIEEVEVGDHTSLPDLKLYTYRISQMIAEEVNEGIEIDGETRDFAFDLNEFFATKDQKFTHEKDVKEFIKNLSTNEKYPFSTSELRDELRHTFWYVGNRVDSVKSLEQLLKQDPIFKEYKIIVAAGDGMSFDQEEGDFKANEESYKKVKKAIKEYAKTITLSCGQLTTGITIKEWNAVLMLTDIKTPAQYMQAAFRAQNPYKFIENGQLFVKQSAYLFDFAPTRVLEIYDQFANALNPKAANGKITEAERKDNIRELLNYFPVISEDIDGRMVELDAEKVLTFPNALAAVEIVKARFMTNLLFNDNIKDVFHFPKEVEDILDKMPVEKNKRVEVSKTDLNLDNARKIEDQKQAKINENSGVILGEKIYRTNIDRIVDNALSSETTEETLDTLPSKVEELAEPVIAKYKEVYRATNAEIDTIRKENTEKIKLAIAEYENSEIKDAERLKENLTIIIEHDFVEQKVEAREQAVVDNERNSKEEEIKDHLRAFTRTIPMFIMANLSGRDITIDNFDEAVSDEDFEDLTSITKTEFHKLRDGFDYEEDDERRHFGGVFDRYRFNASIAEFVAEKQRLANWFTSDDDIFKLIPSQKTNQIFTPKNVVKRMIDDLAQEAPELFSRTDTTFIDLYMKSGLYITEIAKKLFAGTRHLYDSDFDCIKHILEEQMYGLAPTGILHAITNSFIFGFDEAHKVSAKNFIEHDLTPEAKDDTELEKLAELYNKEVGMLKFEAVVGNPPYQENIKGRGDQPPIYHYFLESAYRLSDVVVMIHPARFLFNAGLTPKEWNMKMLQDKRLKVVDFKQKSADVFPGTDIKGGVAITLRDAHQDFGAIGVFTSFTELSTILHKVEAKTTSTLDKIITGRGVYRLTEVALAEHPEIESVQSVGHKTDIGTGAFDALADLLFFEKKPQDGKDYIKVLGLLNGRRNYYWIDRRYVNDPANFEKYKVIVPNANGSGAIGEVLSTPLIGEPLIGYSETFIGIGTLDTEQEAQAALKYVKSKFARTMLGILKITQHNSRDKWSKVPLQDFTEKSDIDWSKSVADVDKQLYAKYDLSEEEIAFIETHVKAME